MRYAPACTRLLIIGSLTASTVFFTSCKRAPEEVVPAEGISRQQELPPIEALELPQQNPDIGITLNSVPQGFAATLNMSYWIEVTDLTSPTTRYAFVAVTPVSPGPTPSSIAEFENRVRASTDGRILDQGTIDTAFGPAQWISGAYNADDGPVEDVHVFVPHPSGTGTMVMTSICPKGTATVDERLVVMQELLTHVS